MTKKEILSALEQSGDVNQKSKSENWANAFKLYQETTKDYHVKMGDCGICYSTVLKWLRQ